MADHSLPAEETAGQQKSPVTGTRPASGLETPSGDKQAVNAQQATQQGQMEFSDQVGAESVKPAGILAPEQSENGTGNPQQAVEKCVHTRCHTRRPRAKRPKPWTHCPERWPGRLPNPQATRSYPKAKGRASRAAMLVKRHDRPLLVHDAKSFFFVNGRSLYIVLQFGK